MFWISRQGMKITGNRSTHVRPSKFVSPKWFPLVASAVPFSSIHSIWQRLRAATKHRRRESIMLIIHTTCFALCQSFSNVVLSRCVVALSLQYSDGNGNVRHSKTYHCYIAVSVCEHHSSNSWVGVVRRQDICRKDKNETWSYTLLWEDMTEFISS